MRILIVSAYFPPYNAIGALRVGKFAKYLVSQGHEVRVVSAIDTTLPKTLQCEIPEEWVVATKWFDLHAIPRMLAGAWMKSYQSGKSGSAAKESWITKAYDWFRALFHWPDRHVAWFIPASRAGRAVIREWRPDVIYASAWPITSLLIGRALSKKFGIPWVAELRDLWLDNHYYQVPAWRRWIDGAIERKLMASASLLVTVSEPLADILKVKFGRTAQVVLNGFDPADFSPTAAPPSGDVLTIAYMGMIYPGARDPTPLFLALKTLGPLVKQVRVRFYGRLLPGVQALIDEHGLANLVEMHPPVPYRESLRIQQESDVLLLLLWDRPEEKGVYTGKLFEYFGARRPILSIGLESGVAASLIRDRKAGIATNSPGAIAEKLRAWITQKTETGSLPSPDYSAVAGLSRDEQFEKLLPALNRVAGLPAAPRRILVITTKLDVGGTERHLLQVLPALSEDFRPRLFVMRAGGSLEPVLEGKGIEVYAPPAVIGTWMGILWTALRVAAEMMISRKAIVHFYLPEAYLVGGMCGVLTRHRNMVMSRRSLNVYQQSHPIAARLERWLHRHMSLIMGNSGAVIQNLRSEGVPESRLRLIYNGIDLSLFDGPSRRDELRARLGIGSTELVIVVVASLVCYKGHKDLIAGLGLVAARMDQPWRLVLVGRDNGMERDLRTQAAELGIAERVVFLGEAANVESVWKIGDIGVLPSHQEGFSNSVLEGMASGLPMIVTDVGGNPEAVEHGVSGIVVPPHSSESLGQAVLELAGDLERRRALGAAARRRIEERFSLDSCISAYRDVYGSEALRHGQVARVHAK